MQDYMQRAIAKSYREHEDEKYVFSDKDELIEYFIETMAYINIIRMYVPVINDGNFITNRVVIDAITDVLYDSKAYLRLMTTVGYNSKKPLLYEYLRDHPAWAQKRIQIRQFECPPKCRFPFEDSNQDEEIVMFGDRYTTFRCHWRDDVSVGGFVNFGAPSTAGNVDKFDDLFLKLKKLKK